MIQHQFDPQANVVPDPTSGATELAFAARNLSVRYYGITVFDDVSFSVEPGAVVAVLGRNGAGKTTLLNCLLGPTVPDSGEAEVGGVRSDALTDAVREHIGYVSQSPDVFDGMTVTESIELIGQFYAGWSPEYARPVRSPRSAARCPRANAIDGRTAATRHRAGVGSSAGFAGAGRAGCQPRPAGAA